MYASFTNLTCLISTTQSFCKPSIRLVLRFVGVNRIRLYSIAKTLDSRLLFESVVNYKPTVFQQDRCRTDWGRAAETNHLRNLLLHVSDRQSSNTNFADVKYPMLRSNGIIRLHSLISWGWRLHIMIMPLRTAKYYYDIFSRQWTVTGFADFRETLSSNNLAT